MLLESIATRRPHNTGWPDGGRVAALLFLADVVIGHLRDVLGQRPGGDVGEAGLFEHRPHAGPQRPPDVGQRRGRTGIRQIAEPDVAHAGQRAVDAAERVGDADVGGGAGQRISAVAAAVAANQAVGAQTGKDVDEKLRRDALGLGQVVGLDQNTFVDGDELHHGPDGILRLGRHPHGGQVSRGCQSGMSLAPGTTTAKRSAIAARLAACIASADTASSPKPGKARVAVAEATTVGE